MPEQLSNNRPAQVFKSILVIGVLIILGWLALGFLYAAAKTIVVIAIAIVLAYFVIRFILGSKRPR
jgi:predicted PurR-regulated permease PerM